MSKRSATITLGGTQYTVKPFNIGELEELEEILGAERGQTGKILAIALRRAEPKCEDILLIEPAPGEIKAAIVAIAELSGLRPQVGAGDQSPLVP